MNYNKLRKSELIELLEKNDKKVRILYTHFTDDYKACGDDWSYSYMRVYDNEAEAVKNIKKMHTYKEVDDYGSGLSVKLTENIDKLEELLKYIHNSEEIEGEFIPKMFEIKHLKDN